MKATGTGGGRGGAFWPGARRGEGGGDRRGGGDLAGGGERAWRVGGGDLSKIERGIGGIGGGGDFLTTAGAAVARPSVRTTIKSFNSNILRAMSKYKR